MNLVKSARNATSPPTLSDPFATWLPPSQITATTPRESIVV